MKLVMTLLVRDAERLLRSNLEFHLAQGVDHFIITDNLSTDGTRDIIEDYVRAKVATLIWEPADTYQQSRWVTRMARMACDAHAADWVVNCDDDEFWFAPESSLRAQLAATPDQIDALAVTYRNHPPVATTSDAPFIETMIYREALSVDATGALQPPKVCHRAFHDIKVLYGNHSVMRFSQPVRLEATDAIRISHFPVRDYASFARKVANGWPAYQRNPDNHPKRGGGWKLLYELLQEGRLQDWYEQQLLTPGRITAGLADGSLARDEFVRDVLRSRIAAPSPGITDATTATRMAGAGDD